MSVFDPPAPRFLNTLRDRCGSAETDEAVVSSALLALRSAVRASGAFMRLLGDGELSGVLGRAVDESTTVVVSDEPIDGAFALSGEDLRVASALLVSPGHAARAGEGSYWSKCSVPSGFERALVLTLHDGHDALGVVGVERRARDVAFSHANAKALVALRPLLQCAAESRRIAALQRRERALQAVGIVRGSVLVVDCVDRRVLRASSWSSDPAWVCPVGRVEHSIVAVTLRLLGQTSDGSDAVLPVAIDDIVIDAVAPLVCPGSTAETSYAAVHLRWAPKGQPLLPRLSAREREVAALLAAGHNTDRVAAMCHLSPHTVRTFTRRIYRKLGVVNRSGLVRAIMRVEP